MKRTFATLGWLVLAAAVPFPGAGAEAPALTPEAVEAAVLQGFPTIEAAAAAVEAERARLDRARRIADPVLELSGGRGEDRAGPESGPEWGAALELELPAPWTYGKATAAAEARIGAAEADLAELRARTVARIRALALRLAAARRSVEVLETQAEMVERLAEFAALRVELGEARELERLRMEVELGRVRRKVDLARAEHDAVAGTLVRLSGGRLPARFRVRVPGANTPPPVDRPALEALLLQANPELAAGLQRARAAGAQAEFQRSLALPTFVTRVETATDYDSRSASLSLAFKVPLWNRNRPATAAAEAEHRRALSEVEFRRRSLLGRLDSAVSRYEAARRTALRFRSEILPAAREATRLAELSYREGETSILDLLDARRNAQDAELENIQAWLQVQLLRVEIDLLTGRLGLATTITDTSESRESRS